MKILIVDDEYYARKAIVKIVGQWQGAPVSMREAEDGAQALGMIGQEKPDVLMVDVRMAEMDGITLCKRVREAYPDMVIFIISGYADFEFAQQAIDLRASKYFLKPVSPQALHEALEEINQVRHEADSRVLRLSRIRLVTRLLHGQQTEQERAETERQRKALLPGHPLYAVAVLQSLEPFSEEEADRLRQLMAQCFPQAAVTLWHDVYPNEILAVLTGEESAEAMQRQMRTAAQALCSALGEPEGLLLSISAPEQTSRSLRQAYEGASMAINRRLLSPQGPCIYAWEPAPNTAKERPPEALTPLMELCVARKTDAARQLVRRHFVACRHSVQSLSRDFQYVRECIRHAAYVLSSSEALENVEPMLSMMRLCDFADLEAVVQYLCGCIDQLDTGARSGQDDTIAKVVAYLETAYAQDVSLSQTAAQVAFMNTCYLSRLIKLKTGRTFSQLLQDVRMRKARALLRGGTLSVSDVAGMVGYTKASNFIDIYKRHYGITPGKERA